ncbi:hypothetical protein CEXT_677321 [Caerostris extrusa]|uniref:Uncharacterized protein n=1 Tax=Caerostris extrusa TaxID=172846 RepID=A0AAV4U665_CAEEX|nr:hypothetical protein CEXT_677321 [Caerostris extrusa]
MKLLFRWILEIALLCLVYARRSSKFKCPHPFEILPCQCYTHPWERIECFDVLNFDIVREALREHHKPVPTLWIKNIYTSEIPRYTFRDMLIKELIIDDSSIEQIHGDAFYGYHRIKILALEEDKLVEFPIEAIKRLPLLFSLSLAGNSIKKITDLSFTRCRRLKILKLENNLISSIDRNSFPGTLVQLSLANNLIASLNGSLTHLSNLSFLSLGHNRLHSVKDDLKGLSQLMRLSLERNSIVNIQGSFDDLLNLTFLNLAHNNLEEVENGLRRLKKLEHLDISHNNITKIDGMFSKDLSGLDALNLSGNRLKNICELLQPFKVLRKLRLSNMSIKSIGKDCFKKMRKLEILDLSKNQLKKIGAVTRPLFPRLLILDLHQNRLETISYGLKNLKNLEKLDIGYNNFRTIRKKDFMRSNKLINFRISGNLWDCSSSSLLKIFKEFGRRMKILGAPRC